MSLRESADFRRSRLVFQNFAMFQCHTKMKGFARSISFQLAKTQFRAICCCRDFCELENP